MARAEVNYLKPSQKQNKYSIQQIYWHSCRIIVTQWHKIITTWSCLECASDDILILSKQDYIAWLIAKHWTRWWYRAAFLSRWYFSRFIKTLLDCLVFGKKKKKCSIINSDICNNLQWFIWGTPRDLRRYVWVILLEKKKRS